MKLSTHFTTLLLMGMAVGPVTPQPSTPRLEPFGLEGERVTALRFSPQFGPYPYKLYATTDGNGVYRHDPIRADSLWLRLGLYDKKITALDIQVWGVGPAIFHAPVVGVAPDYDRGDSTLIYRLENGRWVPSSSGIVVKSSNITSLASFASSGHEPPGATFAVLGGGLDFIYASNSWSHWWQEVFEGLVGAQINVVAANNHSLSHEVWFGGSLDFAPWLGKSIDEGKTWTAFIPNSVSPFDVCYSLAFHPTDPAIVYAGTARTVMKTTDGGKTWRVTGLENNRTYIYGLALDSFNPDHLYAGGATAANQWALWESFNGGTNWREISAPQSIWNIQGISSIVADPNTPGAIYVGTLGGGVWRYQSDVVAVKDRREEISPQGYVLEQNYPNPFNSGTVIRFEIPSSLIDSPARLAIYNLCGELVRELLNKKLPAGNYSVRWDGKDDADSEAASGIYLYQLQAGNVTARRKLTLLK